jgi:hypothetical protein
MSSAIVTRTIAARWSRGSSSLGLCAKSAPKTAIGWSLHARQ